VEPNADQIVLCFADASCDDIASLGTLVPDADLYGCFNGLFFEKAVCGFAGSSPAVCWYCTYDHCASALDACNADADCQEWLSCISFQDCPEFGFADNPECYRECDEKHPLAAALYEAVYACSCSECDDAGCHPHQAACDVAN